MFEAIYISDTANTLVFEYLVTLSSPTFNSLISVIQAKKLSEVSTTSSSSSADDEVPLIQLNRDYIVCYQKTKNLVIYLLVSSTTVKTNPLIPYVFMRHLIEVMEDYFGAPLAVTKIDANNDTLNLLIHEMIDDGLPNITDFNRLRDIIPLKSLLSRIISSTNEFAERAIQSTTNGAIGGGSKGINGGGISSNSGLSSSVNSSAAAQSSSTTATPWRRTNVKYTNNEMFVDVIETINVILKPSKHFKSSQKLNSSSKAFDSAYYSSYGNSSSTSSNTLVPISGVIDGQVNFTSHLTGVPELQMILSIPQYVPDFIPSFHESIKLDRWLNSHGTLSFIPADGKSTLMQYQIDVESQQHHNKYAKKNYDSLGLVDVDFSTGLGTNQNEFELRLFIRQNKGTTKIEDLSIEVFAADSNTGALASSSATTVGNIRSLRCTHGDFLYKGDGKAIWNIRSISTGTQPFLRGIITSDEDEEEQEILAREKGDESKIRVKKGGDSAKTSSANAPVPSTSPSTTSSSSSFSPGYFKLSYSNKGYLPSGIKVDSLKIISAKGLGDAVKPYKGVKYITKAGEYIIRS